ncbi:single-stranded DNA-binding protein [Phormidesmis sp. 146-35]
MNNCILMAEIIQDPQLRYTSDNQTPIAEMRVQIAGLRPDEPPATLKVVGWGNLAQEIQTNYHEGDRVIIEGRLGMNTVDRPEGFKEKTAEMTVQRIHSLVGVEIGSSFSAEMGTTTKPAGVAPTTPPASTPPASTPPASTPRATTKAKVPAAPAPIDQPELDDIPF